MQFGLISKFVFSSKSQLNPRITNAKGVRKFQPRATPWEQSRKDMIEL